MSRRQQQFIQAKDFEKDRFGVSPIDDSKGNKNQYLAYSRYRYANLNSNFDSEDYAENLISFFVTLSL